MVLRTLVTILPAVEITGHLIPDTNSQYDLGYV